MYPNSCRDRILPGGYAIGFSEMGTGGIALYFCSVGWPDSRAAWDSTAVLAHRLGVWSDAALLGAASTTETITNKTVR